MKRREQLFQHNVDGQMSHERSVEPIRVGPMELFAEQDVVGALGVVDMGAERFTVRYKVQDGPIANDPDPMLAITLLPAMRLGRPIQVVGPISPRLARGVPTIQDILHAWDASFEKIEVDAHVVGALQRKPGHEVGLFFTGGLDSFYSFLKHRDEITRLIYVQGFEMRYVKDLSSREEIVRAIRGISAEFGKPLLLVDTNLREFSDRYVRWDLYHGAALASIALLLSPQFRKIYIASSHSYAGLFPLGSHPLLDPLWGTEHIELVHDGCEVTRVEKARYIASSQVALRSLRVCFEGRSGAVNCGMCEKCLRTMVNLSLAGVLAHCTTFERPLDLRAVARIRLRRESLRDLVEENLREAEANGKDRELARALRDCLNERYYRGWWRIRNAAFARLGRLTRRGGGESG